MIATSTTHPGRIALRDSYGLLRIEEDTHVQNEIIGTQIPDRSGRQTHDNGTLSDVG